MPSVKPNLLSNEERRVRTQQASMASVDHGFLRPGSKVLYKYLTPDGKTVWVSEVSPHREDKEGCKYVGEVVKFLGVRASSSVSKMEAAPKSSTRRLGEMSMRTTLLDVLQAAHGCAPR